MTREERVDALTNLLMGGVSLVQEMPQYHESRQEMISELWVVWGKLRDEVELDPSAKRG